MPKPRFTEGRSCGTCSQCCTSLGVSAIKKHTGQTCKHLDGRNPEARCSIYSKRPTACASFQCAWLVGMGADDDRPDKSGMVITAYEWSGDETRGGVTTRDSTPSVTIMVSDMQKAEPTLMTVVQQFLAAKEPVNVRVVFPDLKSGLYFSRGMIHRVRLWHDGYEDLSFENIGPPLGAYIQVSDTPTEESS